MMHDQLDIILILKPNLLCEDTERTLISLVWIENFVLYHLYKILFVKNLSNKCLIPRQVKNTANSLFSYLFSCYVVIFQVTRFKRSS